jgi:hypothetical protein
MDSIRELTDSDLAAVAGGEDYYIGDNPIQGFFDQLSKNVAANTAPPRPPIDHSALDPTS